MYLRNPTTGNFGKKTPFRHSDSPMYEFRTLSCLVHVQPRCMALVVSSVVTETLLSLCLPGKTTAIVAAVTKPAVRESWLRVTSHGATCSDTVSCSVLFVCLLTVNWSMPSVMLQYCALQSLRTSLLTDSHHFVHTAAHRVCLLVCRSVLLFTLRWCCHGTRARGRDSNE